MCTSFSHHLMLAALTCTIQACIALAMQPSEVIPTGTDATSRDAQYQAFKQDVLTNCVDSHGIVCDRRNGRLVGQGDGAWRTGILLLCLAIEQDHENASKVLTALENCWRDGRPVRHPGDEFYLKMKDSKNHFSRDQFWPQFAALHYLNRFGTPDLKERSKKLMQRFVDVLDRHDWSLNNSPSAEFSNNAVHGRWVIMKGAHAMGVTGPWEGSNRFSREVKRFEYKTYRELWIASIHALAANAKLAMQGLDRDKDNPNEYHAVFNKFMQLLVIYDCERGTGGMTDAVNELTQNTARHKNAPLLWLNGQNSLSDQVLDQWPQEWNNTDFVWQRNLHNQREAAKAPQVESGGHPRLDYMLMYNLRKLDSRFRRGK